VIVYRKHHKLQLKVNSSRAVETTRVIQKPGIILRRFDFHVHRRPLRSDVLLCVGRDGVVQTEIYEHKAAADQLMFRYLFHECGQFSLHNNSQTLSQRP